MLRVLLGEHLVVIELSQVLVLWVLLFQLVEDVHKLVDASLDFVLLALFFAFLVTQLLRLDDYNEFILVVFNFLLQLNTHFDVWVVKATI